MNWGTIETALESVFRTASGVADLQVRWAHANEGNTYREASAGLVLDLSVVSLTTTGRGETLLDEVSATELAESVYGVRSLALQLKTETFAQPYEAIDLLDKITVGIYSDSAASDLTGTALTVASVGLIQYTPYMDQGRLVGAATAEIIFNAHTLLTLDNIPFVDRVSGEATYNETLVLPFDTEDV